MKRERRNARAKCYDWLRVAKLLHVTGIGIGPEKAERPMDDFRRWKQELKLGN